jgi:phage terminase Nu1 subunit (DNA packaging protein)
MVPKSKKSQTKTESEPLKGWREIATFLGQPVSVAQRWAETGMPVQKRGRNVYSSREELNRWLGRESAGEPVHIATDDIDLSSELKRGLSHVRGIQKKK